MKLFSRLFANRRDSNPVTVFERRRLGNTMPGQTAALAAQRFGYIVN